MHALLVSAAYVGTQIIVPGATVQQAFGLNDKGQTAVTTTDGTAGIYRHGTFTALPAPPAGFTAAPTDINNEGVIVGGVTPTPAGTPEQGFVLHGSTYTFFARPNWDNTEARAISDSGLVTGFSYSSDFSQSAGFIYDPATGIFTDATPPGSNSTITQGMNKHGRIAGNGRNPTVGKYGFVWQQGNIAKGKTDLLPFLSRITVDNSGSAARGINDSGVVVGFNNSGEGFVGSDARGYQLLIAPGGDPANNLVTICEGINNDAQVVCSVGDNNNNGVTVGAFIGSPREGDDEDDHGEH